MSVTNPAAHPPATQPPKHSKLVDFFLDFHNRTILFQVGNWIVTTYALVAGAAFAMGVAVTLWFDLMTGQDALYKAKFYVFFLVPAILIGLRSFSIMLEWRELLEHPLQTMLKPGYMLHGGILGGTIAFAVYASVTNTSLLLLLDGAALALPLGESIARLGCFVYGCCWGAPTQSRFGVRYTSEHSKVVRRAPHLQGVKIHPVQLYSLVIHLVMFGAFYLLLPYRAFDGMIAAVYLISHSIVRYPLEQFRQDDRGKLWGPFTHTHLYSTAMILGGTAILIVGRSGTLTPVNMNVSLWSTIADPQILPWIAFFYVVFFLSYGVSYKSVGSWLTKPGADVRSRS